MLFFNTHNHIHRYLIRYLPDRCKYCLKTPRVLVKISQNYDYPFQLRNNYANYSTASKITSFSASTKIPCYRARTNCFVYLEQYEIMTLI